MDETLNAASEENSDDVSEKLSDETVIHSLRPKLSDETIIYSLPNALEPEKSHSLAQQFADFIASLSRRKLRVRPRVKTFIPIFLEIRGRIYPANLTDISPLGMKIDQKIPIMLRERCSVIIKTEPAVEMLCMPIIGAREFDEGAWDRLTISTNFNFEALIELIKVTLGEKEN